MRGSWHAPWATPCRALSANLGPTTSAIFTCFNCWKPSWQDRSEAYVRVCMHGHLCKLIYDHSRSSPTHVSMHACMHACESFLKVCCRLTAPCWLLLDMLPCISMWAWMPVTSILAIRHLTFSLVCLLIAIDMHGTARRCDTAKMHGTVAGF